MIPSRQDIFYPSHNPFYRLGVGRKRDNRLEAKVTFAAVPKMADLPLIPILGPLGGNQLIVASNAFHPEAWTAIGYRLHFI
jgi:hypothetical protein